jgi:pyruvate dehydrogenase E1 component alpha subunit
MATTKISVKKETLLDWYRQIVLIRKFEAKCDELYHDKRITGVYLHLYSGHEATGVGALAALREDDNVITAYRDHGIAIARGVDPKPLMAEMMGKVDGISGGKGGSMHLASREHNFWGGYAIVGGHLPLAAGIALESRYNNKDTVTLSFIGDGATNNGYFHESLNMSAIWDLPVVWVIENNLYGMGTPVEVASGQPELVKKAVAYGMKEGGRIDGQNVVEVYEAVSEAVDYARKHGPVLIESITFRYKGHGVSDRWYDQREDELAAWRDKDPIGILEGILRDNYKNVDSQFEKIAKEADEIVAEAVEFAENSPMPGYAELISNVYVEE